MAQGNPMPGEQYLHFKNKLYQIITIAYHSETMERYVVYQALYGDFKTYVRPYDMFISEVDHEKYPHVKQKYRFQYLGNMAEAHSFIDKEIKEPPSLKNDQECTGEVLSREQEKDVSASEGEGQLNPWLDKILDAPGFDEKYEIICDMQMDVTDRLIDDIAVVMDLAIPEGDLRERYAQLKYCVRTRQKYESGRLR